MKGKSSKRSPIAKAFKLLNWLIEAREAEVGIRQTPPR